MFKLRFLEDINILGGERRWDCHVFVYLSISCRRCGITKVLNVYFTLW